jgi:uncharacterized membrane protein YfcA
VASKYFSTKYLELSLGIFLICLSLIFLLNENLAIKKGPIESLLGGSLSGFIAGLLGTGGAIRGITMAAFNLEKNVYVATSAFIDIGVDFTRTLVYFFNGYMKQEIIIYIPFLLIIGFLGTYIGRYILNYISQKNFKKISLILILIIGLITLAKVNLT